MKHPTEIIINTLKLDLEGYGTMFGCENITLAPINTNGTYGGYLAVLRCIDIGLTGEENYGYKTYMGIISSLEDWDGMKDVMEHGTKFSYLESIARKTFNF